VLLAFQQQRNDVKLDTKADRDKARLADILVEQMLEFLATRLDDQIGEMGAHYPHLRAILNKRKKAITARLEELRVSGLAGGKDFNAARRSEIDAMAKIFPYSPRQAASRLRAETKRTEREKTAVEEQAIWQELIAEQIEGCSTWVRTSAS
jgi:glycyl-tRNA synthetase beta subunit